MKKLIASFVLCSVFASGAMAIQYHKVVVNSDGTANGVLTAFDRDKQSLGPNEYPVGTQFPKTAFKYWKKVGTVWTEMSQAEKDDVDSGIKDRATNVANWSPDIEALVLVICDKWNISTNEMHARLKSKIKVKKLKNKK